MLKIFMKFLITFFLLASSLAASGGRGNGNGNNGNGNGNGNGNNGNGNGNGNNQSGGGDDIATAEKTIEINGHVPLETRLSLDETQADLDFSSSYNWDTLSLETEVYAITGFEAKTNSLAGLRVYIDLPTSDFSLKNNEGTEIAFELSATDASGDGQIQTNSGWINDNTPISQAWLVEVTAGSQQSVAPKIHAILKLRTAQINSFAIDSSAFTGIVTLRAVQN